MIPIISEENPPSNKPEESKNSDEQGEEKGKSYFISCTNVLVVYNRPATTPTDTSPFL